MSTQSEWPVVALNTVANFLSGGTPSKARAHYWSGDIPWVSAKDMKEQRVRDSEDHITMEALENGSRIAPKGATLVLVRGMTLLSDVPICVLERDVAFNQDIKAIVARNGINAVFLNYALLAAKPLLLSYVEFAGHGTGRLPTDRLQALQIPIPSKSEQTAVARVLTALDDKIELNRRMNETLEAMTRAIFKSWFVNFDPVRAKAEGRQPPGMNADTAALFPDSFQDSPLGKIPRGWRVGKLAEIAWLSRDSVNPGAFPDEVFDHYSIPAFDEGRWPKEEAGIQIKSNKSLVPPNSVLISKLNPRFPRVWLPSLSNGKRSIASTEFLVTSAREPFNCEYLFGLFTSESFFQVFATLVTGTSSSHQRVRAEFLHEMDALIPPGNCAASFSRTAGPLYATVTANLTESRTLSAIRDTLLPKLVSGEIRVSSSGVAEVPTS